MWIGYGSPYETLYIAISYATILLCTTLSCGHNSAKQPKLSSFIAKGMVEKRINNTEPVVQARLCVVVGNFYGIERSA